MRRWNLPLKTPLALVLAADARLTDTDYSDDHIWELTLAGEPPAVAVRTTFGLRARAFGIFPCFVVGEEQSSDPANFVRPPVLQNYYPNFARLEFSPFNAIDVVAEIWVPQSQAILGRYEVSNNTAEDVRMQVEMAAVLTPGDGQRMSAEKIQATWVLAGRTENLHPLLFMTGGAQPGKRPYPCLALAQDIPAGETRTFCWSQAAKNSPEQSFELARQLCALSWEAHIARLEMLNAGEVEVYTGDPDWDLAFSLSQTNGLSLMLSPRGQLPEASFVETRLPDQGYSLRGDGSDYSHLWSGQAPLEAYYLADFLLPAYPELGRGILRNYFAVQQENGFIDWKPGLGGQRSRALATPILAKLTWKLYQVARENNSWAKDFLMEAYPALQRFLDAWFSGEHDVDQDGLPEWDHPMQFGIADHPLFSPWQAWSQGADIRSAESPALGALLYQECLCMAKMAPICGDIASVARYNALAEKLRQRLNEMWDEEAQHYVYQDRDSHTNSPGRVLRQHKGSGKIILQERFAEPARLLVRIQSSGEIRPHPQVFIHGESSSGQHRVERISEGQIRWSSNVGLITGERVYHTIEMVELQGLLPEDAVTLATVGFDCEDISLLLPLWAGIPSEEQAEGLFQNHLTSPQRYWRTYGIPVCPQPDPESEAICGQVNLPLNRMVGEALLAYGYRRAAAELVSRLMAGVVVNLKRQGRFFHSFHAQGGEGAGERNSLNGLAPLGLFLETLGVHPVSPHCVYLEGFNPFSSPVTVKYRGLTVLRQMEKTVVIFPDGQTVEVSDPAPVRVCLEA